MATQSTPHNNTQQNNNSAQDDLDPNMSPEDTLRADPSLYANTDGAQTAGTRSFHANDTRDTQPKSLDEGTANTSSNTPNLPQDGAQGITSSAPAKERETQEKVTNS